MTMRDEQQVIRFVITHHDAKTGLRTIIGPVQGRYTYATREEAERWIADAIKNNGPERLNEFYGFPLRAVPCPCWPGHFDPKTVYPEEQ